MHRNIEGPYYDESALSLCLHFYEQRKRLIIKKVCYAEWKLLEVCISGSSKKIDFNLVISSAVLCQKALQKLNANASNPCKNTQNWRAIMSGFYYPFYENITSCCISTIYHRNLTISASTFCKVFKEKTKSWGEDIVLHSRLT